MFTLILINTIPSVNLLSKPETPDEGEGNIFAQLIFTMLSGCMFIVLKLFLFSWLTSIAFQMTVNGKFFLLNMVISESYFPGLNGPLSLSIVPQLNRAYYSTV